MLFNKKINKKELKTMTQEKINKFLKELEEKTATIKFVLDYKKEDIKGTKLLILFIDESNYQFVVGYRYEYNFKVSDNRILDYWEHGTYFGSLKKAIEEYSEN